MSAPPIKKSDASTRPHLETMPNLRALPSIEPRFAAIWGALAILLMLDALFLPRAVALSTLLSILPFAMFLAIAAAGQTLVIMMRGIDLSAPAIVSATSTILLTITRPGDEQLWPAIAAALAVAILIGTLNGVLVSVIKLNSLIVTLAVGSIVTGLTIYYRDRGAISSMVSPSLSTFSSGWIAGIPVSAVVAVSVLIISTIILRKTSIGRKFELVGTNPVAAYISGIGVQRYQVGAFIVASFLYGVMAVVLSGFIRNPTIDVGTPYLLAPIAAAVLGGTAINGGIGSLVAVFGAALFLTQLDQSLKMLGLSTAWQMIIQGMAIASGMYLSERLSKQKVKT